MIEARVRQDSTALCHDGMRYACNLPPFCVQERDLQGQAFTSLSGLEQYCDFTVGSLLYLGLEACGIRDDIADIAARYVKCGKNTGELASCIQYVYECFCSHVAIATGICTILRNVPVHAQQQQRYIPDDLLAKVSE